uniref:Izumo protein immunoglobulin domain-containing protein n=1 Tax=Sciurus vulgaris TaxID=55149 RepID=A0A8D2DG75_SCIVU
MGLCFALSLATLACCLLPAGCCVTCSEAVRAALKSLKENYLPGHLDTKLHQKVKESIDKLTLDFKKPDMKGFLGAIGEGRRDLESLVLGKDGLDFAPSGMMLQRMLWCPECNTGNYLCWKSLDCGGKHGTCLELLWHHVSEQLTDYQFFRDWEDGGETLLYKGKNPILIIPSVTSDDTGLYRCELGTQTAGPSTIIRYHVTVLSPNATEESTTNFENEDETAQGETGPPAQGETGPPVQGGGT